MPARLQWIVLSLALDSLVAVALAFPDAAAHLRWPLLAVYALLSVALFRKLRAHSWMLRIVHDPGTRIAHGLEHATLGVLVERKLPVIHGFTHGRHRFVVALDADRAPHVGMILEAATSAVGRVQRGEHGLAYHPGCGTSDAVSALTLWVVYVGSVVFTLVVGGSVPIFVAVGVLVLRIWLACETSLGLLAQRLFTVSTKFTSARVLDVREVSKIWHMVRPQNEAWFEVVVDFQIRVSRGGLVSPSTPS